MNEEGARLLASGDFPAALARFQAASRLDPRNREIQFNAGLALLRMNKAREAAGYFKNAASDPALTDEARYLLASAYFQLADYANAAAQIEHIESGPRLEHILYMREECHRLLGRAAEARADFATLNRRFPDSSWLHFLMGNAYENQSQPDQALAEYKLALERDPHQPNAAFAAGYLYWRQQDYDNAKPWFEKELTVQSCHALAAFYLGEIARANQDANTAARFYQRSLECNPDAADAHLRLGTVLAMLKRNDEALRELRRAAQLDPQNTSPHYRLALLYKALGRAADARSEYATIQRIQDSKAKSGALAAAQP